MLDISRVESEDIQLLTQLKDRKRVIIINKIDLPRQWDSRYLLNSGYIDDGVPVVEISLTEDDLEPLLDCIINLIMGGVVQIERKMRHYGAQKARVN